MLNLRRATSARPSAALVISIIALVASLTGTAFAAGVLPANSVGTSQVRDKAISAAKLRGNAVTTTTVANGSLLARDFARGEMRATAYAQVTGGTSPTFTSTATRGFGSIARTGVGTYCLTPSPGISSATRPAVVSAMPTDPLTTPVPLVTVSPAGCAAGEYKVETYLIYTEAMGGPLRADDVSFSIIVA